MRYLVGLLVLVAPPTIGQTAPSFQSARVASYAFVSPEARPGGWFGNAVAGTADLDGDGLGDLVVGAFGEDGDPEGAGRVHVFSGATGAFRYTLVSQHPSTGGGFGGWVAPLPDIDGDGQTDLLVGAQIEPVTVAGVELDNAGRVYVHSGATGAWLYTLQSPNAEAGGAFAPVAAVPDADGDGRADVLVGGFRERVGTQSTAGRAYLFSGADGHLLLTLESPEPSQNAHFGAHVAGLPDVDGDGAGDLVVAAAEEGVLLPGPIYRAGAGRVHVFSGATGVLIRTLISPAPERLGAFGSGVASLDDVDGDGVADLAVAAFLEDAPGMTDAGRVHLFSGATGTLLRTVVSPSPIRTGTFGEPVAAVPDVDGDGRGDLLVGAHAEEGYAGRAYLFSGATGALLASLRSPNAAAEGFFGHGVAGVPDTDGDGRGDLLIGAPKESREGVDRAGGAYLFRETGAVAVDKSPEAESLAVSITPNPARGAVTLGVRLSHAGALRLTVVDALGRVVVTAEEGWHPSGPRTIALDTGRLAPGLYLARLDTPDGQAGTPLVVVR